jgi:hypothetical protein
MPVWHGVNLENVEQAGGRNGTMKFTIDGGKPFRFQIPKGRVMYNGVSEYGSMTIDVPGVFGTWWRESLESALVGGLVPFNSNLKESGLRIKVDKSTQLFNAQKEIQFQDVKEGLLANTVVTCIIEITGTYFFKEVFGLTCRAYQVVVNEVEAPSAQPETIDDGDEPVKGFAFMGV